MNTKTGILLSGGMDSIAVAYWKRPNYAFTVNYGQKAAEAEIHSATQVCRALQIDHHIIHVDCSKLGSGEMSQSESLDISPAMEWWPYRNQLLVTLACMKGLSFGISEMFVGSVASDKVHADGRREFYNVLSSLMELQEGNVKISCPAIELSTVQLIRAAELPRSLLYWAHSCHTNTEPCGNCNGCRKYLSTLQQLEYD